MKKILLIVCCFFSFISFGDNGGEKTIQVKKTDFDECKSIYITINKAYEKTTVPIGKYLTPFFKKYGDKKNPIKIDKADIDRVLVGLDSVLKQANGDAARKRIKDKNGKIIILTDKVQETGKIKSLESKIKDTKLFVPVKPEVATKSGLLLDPQTKDKIDSLERVIEGLKKAIKELNQDSGKITLEEDISFWRNLGIFFLFLSLTGFGAFAREHFWVLPNTIKEKGKLLETFSNSQSENFNRKEEDWKTEKNSLEERIKVLEKGTHGVTNTSGSGDTGNEQKQVKEPQTGGKPVEPPKTPENTRQFYLSTPAISSDGQGFFDGSEVYNSATALSSLYEFVLDNDKRSADFKFLNTPNNVHDSLKFPDRYIQPACEYSGLNSKATKIITTKAGRALKDGNNWKIIKKAEIRFE
jgi:hypothetical protein